WTQPVAGLHESSVHPLPSSQFGGGPPAHAPPEQTSFVVQALPSLHAAVLFACTQPEAGWQESLVQTLPSLQLGGVPGLQMLFVQVSVPLQALPSAQSPLVAQVCVVVYWTVSLGRSAAG